MAPSPPPHRRLIDANQRLTRTIADRNQTIDDISMEVADLRRIIDQHREDVFELSAFDNLFRDVALPESVRSGLSDLLLASAGAHMHLRNELAHSARDLHQRAEQLEALKAKKKAEPIGLRKENAVLQSRLAEYRKQLSSFKNITPPRKDRFPGVKAVDDRKELPHHKPKVSKRKEELHHSNANIGNLRKQNRDLEDQVVSLRKQNADLCAENARLRGVVNDRGEGGLLALFEGGTKLVAQQAQRLTELTTRIDKAAGAEREARRERETSERICNEKLEEKDAAIAALKADSDRLARAQQKQTAAGLPVRLSINAPATTSHGIERPFASVQALQRDVEDRDRTIAQLHAREVKLHASRAELLSSVAAGKKQNSELQKKLDASKKSRADLMVEMVASQKLVSDLNEENKKLVKEIGRRI